MYAFATPGVNAPNWAGAPRVSASVAGTVPPAVWAPLTVTVNVLVDWLPWASVAVQVTCVWPTTKDVPEAGVQTTSGLGSSLSVAVGSA